MQFIILFGGNSYEHEVSIVSAITLKKELKNISHFIFLDSINSLYLIPNNKMTSKHFSTFAYKKDSKIEFCPNGFLKKGFLKSEVIRGIVINLVHGKMGEDGMLASIFNFYDIKFIGPRNEACVVSFNKEYGKVYAKYRGVNVLNYEALQNTTKIEPNLINHLASKLPLIFKPARLGSSIGISIVKNENEIAYALDSALEFDDTIIIESFIPNIKEYNLAGTLIDNEFKFSIIEEVNKGEYLDFEKKYLDFGARNLELDSKNQTKTPSDSKDLIKNQFKNLTQDSTQFLQSHNESSTNKVKKKEANISEELKNKIKESFKKIYLNCFEGSLIRCDFFVIENEVYLNEINPIPGSMAHYLFDDINAILNKLATNIPKVKNIKIQYKYISKIQAHKGK